MLGHTGWNVCRGLICAMSRRLPPVQEMQWYKPSACSRIIPAGLSIHRAR